MTLETHSSLDARRRLRLLYVTARFHPLVGGTESHTFEVGSRLASRGHAVTVLTTDLDGNLPPEEECAGMRILRARAYPRNRDYYFSPSLYRLIGAGAWDLVHIQGYHTLVAPLAMLAARRGGLPYLLTFHSGGSSSSLRNALRKTQLGLMRPLLAGAKRLVAVSAFEKAHFGGLLGLPEERFVVIPNGASLPVPSAPQGEKNGKLILSVGRLERYKGHHRLLQALPLVAGHFPDVRLQILGAGPYRARLEEQAHALGVAERVSVRLLDFSAREEMASLLQAADLVALLSEYESYAISALEAIYLRRPVLVADASALHELVAKGLAQGVPVKSSPGEIAEAILRQLYHPTEPPPIDLPTWEDCAEALEQLYLSI